MRINQKKYYIKEIIKMKKVFTFLVAKNEAVKLEGLLNNFRIGLNDWDRSKVLDVQGEALVNYTIVCDDDTFNSIVNQMYATRVY
jgi:hypothetical protein